MDHDTAVGKNVSSALLSGCKEDGCHAACLSGAVHVDFIRTAPEEVVDGKSSVDLAAGAVDINVDGLIRSGEKQHCLCESDCGSCGDRFIEEEPPVRKERAFQRNDLHSSGGFFDVGYSIHRIILSGFVVVFGMILL